MLSFDEPEIETACRGARSLGPETRSPRIRRPCVEHLLRGALEMKPPLDRPRAVLMAVPSGGGPNPNPPQAVLVDRPTATRNGPPCRTRVRDGLLPGRTTSHDNHGARLCTSLQ